MRAALAVPVFLGREAGERPAAVVEAAWTTTAVPIADALLALGCALQGAGLLVSYNKAFTFSPAAVRSAQRADDARADGPALALRRRWRRARQRR